MSAQVIPLPPDAVLYPDSGFRTDGHALRLWAAHMYDTGGEPYYNAETVEALRARAEQAEARIATLRETAAGTPPATPREPAEDAGRHTAYTLANGVIPEHLAQPDAAAEGKQEAGDYMRGWEDANAGRAPRLAAHPKQGGGAEATHKAGDHTSEAGR